MCINMDEVIFLLKDISESIRDIKRQNIEHVKGKILQEILSEIQTRLDKSDQYVQDHILVNLYTAVEKIRPYNYDEKENGEVTDIGKLREGDTESPESEAVEALSYQTKESEILYDSVGDETTNYLEATNIEQDEPNISENYESCSSHTIQTGKFENGTNLAKSECEINTKEEEEEENTVTSLVDEKQNHALINTSLKTVQCLNEVINEDTCILNESANTCNEKSNLKKENEEIPNMQDETGESSEVESVICDSVDYNRTSKLSASNVASGEPNSIENSEFNITHGQSGHNLIGSKIETDKENNYNVASHSGNVNFVSNAANGNQERVMPNNATEEEKQTNDNDNNKEQDGEKEIMKALELVQLQITYSLNGYSTVGDAYSVLTKKYISSQLELDHTIANMDKIQDLIQIPFSKTMYPSVIVNPDSMITYDGNLSRSHINKLIEQLELRVQNESEHYESPFLGEDAFHSGLNFFVTSKSKNNVGNTNDWLKCNLVHEYTNEGIQSIMNSNARATLRTRFESYCCNRIAHCLGFNHQRWHSNNMHLNTLLNLCKVEVWEHEIRMHISLMQLFNVDDIGNLTEQIHRTTIAQIKRNPGKSSTEMEIISGSDEYLEHSHQNNAMVSNLTRLNIRNVGMFVVLFESYRLFVMFLASGAHILTALNTEYKYRHRISARLNVVLFEYFESAMRESIRIRVQLTFTNIYTHDNRIPTAVPIYEYGFIFRKDNIR